MLYIYTCVHHLQVLEHFQMFIILNVKLRQIAGDRDVGWIFKRSLWLERSFR